MTVMPREFGGVRRDDGAVAVAVAVADADVDVVDLATSPLVEPNGVDGRGAGDDDASGSESDIPPLRERLGLVGAGTSPAPRANEPAKASSSRRWTEDEREDALTSWIIANEDVYERVLLMESIDVDDALVRARESGIRCSRADFVAYLEAEGVCFSQTKKRARRAANAREAR
jgi:hypothetical protein